MELLTLVEDVRVLSVPVETFPKGITEVFDALSKKLPDGNARSYYGISFKNNQGGIIYKAAATEKFYGEAEKYNYEPYLINKGQYLAITIFNWYEKIDSIKNVFHEMMQDVRVDLTQPCIEWYKYRDEMMCMMKMIKS